ncbi:uncharacterized protein LOC102808390 [Saccoglossus kowalevskii]
MENNNAACSIDHRYDIIQNKGDLVIKDVVFTRGRYQCRRIFRLSDSYITRSFEVTLQLTNKKPRPRISDSLMWLIGNDDIGHLGDGIDDLPFYRHETRLAYVVVFGCAVIVIACYFLLKTQLSS